MSQTNRLLGYPADARLLIINADDFGMCPAVNEAIIGTLQKGIVQSTTLMVPCPGAEQAMRFLKAHPEIPFGVHLTVISDWDNYRWGPITASEKIPSLINKAGFFYNFEQMAEFLAQVRLDELEMEFSAQIDAVLAAGLKPTHLDWHSLRLGGGGAVSELMFTLAQKYGLAMRVRGQSWIKEVQRRGLPTNDTDFLDSYLLDPTTKTARYTQLLQELPAGLSEWAVHPGLANAEQLAIDPDDAQMRQADFNFLISQQAKDIVEKEGIILLDYRALQEIWRKT